MIYNNTIMDAKYNGIQVVTSWGSTFSISDIHINNNSHIPKVTVYMLEMWKKDILLIILS